MSKRKVPSVPGSVDPVLRNFLSAVREVINSGALGDTVINQTNITGEGGTTVTEADLSALNPNLAALLSSATPTTPTGLTITGLFTNIFVNWNAAPYTYHSFTEVWRANALDGSGALIPAASINFATDAKQVATSIGNIYVDNVEPGSKYYYWIRHVSVAGNKSAYNASLGTLGETTKDVNTVLTDKGWTIGVDNLYAASAWIGTADILDGHVTNAKIGNVIQSDIYSTVNKTGWQIDKAGNITSYGAVDLRDGNGNTILTTGINAGVKWASIVDKTSWVQQSGITVANASTFIENGAINNLMFDRSTGNKLSIGTLDIQGQAVTFPAAAYSAGGISVGSGLTLVQTLTVTTTGEKCFIFCSYFTIFGNNYYLYRDGNLLSSGSTSGPVSTSLMDTPVSGTHTYSLYAQSGSSFTLTVSSISLMLLELRR